MGCEVGELLEEKGKKGEGQTTDTERLLKEREENVPPAVFNVTPLFAERAEGTMITDVDGKQYIDFAGGIGVLNVGHRPRA